MERNNRNSGLKFESGSNTGRSSNKLSNESLGKGLMGKNPRSNSNNVKNHFLQINPHFIMLNVRKIIIICI